MNSMERMKKQYCIISERNGWNSVTGGWPDVLEWKEEEGKLNVRFIELKNRNDCLHKNQIQTLKILDRISKEDCKIEVGLSIGSRELVGVERIDTTTNSSRYNININKLKQGEKLTIKELHDIEGHLRREEELNKFVGIDCTAFMFLIMEMESIDRDRISVQRKWCEIVSEYNEQKRRLEEELEHETEWIERKKESIKEQLRKKKEEVSKRFSESEIEDFGYEIAVDKLPTVIGPSTEEVESYFNSMIEEEYTEEGAYKLTKEKYGEVPAYNIYCSRHFS
mgnify:CR=1 FL=1